MYYYSTHEVIIESRLNCAYIGSNGSKNLTGELIFYVVFKEPPFSCAALYGIIKYSFSFVKNLIVLPN